MGALINAPGGFEPSANDGTGKFTPINYTFLGLVQIQDLVPADFNKDGKTDVAVAGTTDNGEYLNVGLGDGTGRFTFKISSLFAGGVIATADFNSDSVLDLVGSDGLTFTVTALYGVGDGTFVSTPPLLP